jgi:hypothetical protein
MIRYTDDRSVQKGVEWERRLDGRLRRGGLPFEEDERSRRRGVGERGDTGDGRAASYAPGDVGRGRERLRPIWS